MTPILVRWLLHVEVGLSVLQRSDCSVERHSVRNKRWLKWELGGLSVSRSMVLVATWAGSHDILL
jgi:hypothetical protein